MKTAKKARAQWINWHVAKFLIPIQTPEKGTQLRRDISFVSGSNHSGPNGLSISQFRDPVTERLLERHSRPLPGSQLFDAWHLMSDDETETMAAVGDQLYEGRFTVAEKSTQPTAPKTPKAPTAATASNPRARKALLFGKYSATAVARLMGSRGFSPVEALHVLAKLGAASTITSMRTFCYAGKRGERGELPALTAEELGQLDAHRATAPAAAVGGGRARMSIWGHPATAVLRWMGANGFNPLQALAALEDLQRKKLLEKLPSPASIKIFLQAGRAGRRGDPATLTEEQAEALLTYRTEGAVGAAKQARSREALSKAKAAAGELPVAPKPKAKKAEPEPKKKAAAAAPKAAGAGKPAGAAKTSRKSAAAVATA